MRRSAFDSWVYSYAITNDHAIGQVKKNVDPLSGVGFQPDTTAVSLHDLLADCQSDTRTLITIRVVLQALEDAKDPFMILRSTPMPLSRTDNSHTLPLRAAETWISKGPGVVTIVDSVADQVL